MKFQKIMDFSAKKHLNCNIIKNIIFDFGGVIINIDYTLTATAFKHLGVKNFDKLFSQVAQSRLFDKLEVGEISPTQFREELKEIIGINLSDEQINNAWNAMLLDYPKHRLDFLTEIKSHYRTFLLSNTNQIHMESYLLTLKNVSGLKNLESLFEKVYLSHQVRLRKPNEDIYKKVLSENELIPEETLFIDDTAKNLIAPKKLGMQVYHLSKEEDVVDFAQKCRFI